MPGAAGLVVHNEALRALLCERYTPASLARLRAALQAHGTLAFRPLPNGLFPASRVDAESARTGYRHVWVRDNVHVAYAHAVDGDAPTAARTALALAAFYARHRHRFVDVIHEPALAHEPARRPHVRFDGEALAELPERWAHDQNDALGSFVWLYATLGRAGELAPEAADPGLVALFLRYFHAIRYWEDRDSGHWEEPPRRVSAASIGAVVAGLRALELWADDDPTLARRLETLAPRALRDELLGEGAAALARILPFESRAAREAPGRAVDSALLFLVHPYDVVDAPMGAQIVERVVAHLQGPYGIKRYLRDSFYCRDYESHLASEHRTRDFSDDIAMRDRLFTEGGEAQWCLFDPVVSAIHAVRFLARGDPDDFARQTVYLNRALGQVTGNDCAQGAWLCPELYYEERGRWQTSRSTPLLWTQANLRVALALMEASLRRGIAAVPVDEKGETWKPTDAKS